MPAVAELEELKAVDDELKKIKEEFSDAYERFVKLFKSNRRIGYKNIIKMMIGEATPEDLKGLS